MINEFGVLNDLNDKNVTVLYTPGLDSFLTSELLQMANVKHDKVYFDINSRYTDHEIIKMDSNHVRYDLISNLLNLQKYEHPDAFIPNRNLLLISLAQLKYNSDVILMSGFKDDRVSDNNEIFCKQLSDVLSTTAKKKIIVTSLFWEFEKSEILEKYLNFKECDVKYVNNMTYSCYDPVYNYDVLQSYKYLDNDKFIKTGQIKVEGCRKCKACFRRLCAFAYNGLCVPFNDIEMVNKYYNATDLDNCPNRIKSIKIYKKFHDECL